MTAYGAAPSPVEDVVVGRPGERRAQSPARPTFLQIVLKELMLSGNRWVAPAELAERIAQHGQPRVGATETKNIADRIVTLAAAKRSPIVTAPGAIRIWTLDTAEPDGIALPCVACHRRFRTEGGQLAWLGQRNLSIPRRCQACRTARKEPGPAEAIRAMAAEREREAQERRSHQQHRGGSAEPSHAYDYEPGEGPGTPHGCIHGLPRDICRTCSHR